jgi:predicted DNA-binding ribbon-helix-helix protein
MSRKLKPAMIARNVTVGGNRTSLRMEPAMWDAVTEVIDREDTNIHDFCTKVARGRGAASMTAAIRVFALNYFRAAATEPGHRAAGHGKAATKRRR